MTLSLPTKLTQFGNKFAAIKQDFNWKDMENSWRNPVLSRHLWLLNFRKTAFDKFDCTIKEKLTKWRIGKISAEQAYSQPSESKKLTARYNLVQTLKKIVPIVCFILMIIGGVGAMAGMVIVYPPGLPTLVPFYIKVVAPIALNLIVCGGFGSVASEALNYVRVVRKRRVEQSKDFHDFVCKYVNNSDNRFYATKEQMMDLKLHSLYKDYKRHINGLHHLIMS